VPLGRLSRKSQALFERNKFSLADIIFCAHKSGYDLTALQEYVKTRAEEDCDAQTLIEDISDL
jgi:hypothetical protein